MPLTSLDGVNLLRDGAAALARLEANGIRVDTARLDAKIAQTEKEIADLEDRVRADKHFKHWRNRFGDRVKLLSRDQIAYVLFDKEALGRTPKEFTATRKPKADEEALRAYADEVPLVNTFLALAKKNKLLSTYLLNLKKEVVDGYLHANYNLHSTVTFRSSSGSDREAGGGKEFNFQNVPVRNPEVSEAIRSCFVPRLGRVLVEMDFGQLEVRISACYHRDPNMVNYLLDPSSDMHRDTACDLFLISQDDIGRMSKKGPRDWAKNRFVFPEFYGSVYFQCAPHLWEGVTDASALNPDGTLVRPDLAMPGGSTIRQHLKKKGIRELGDCAPGAVNNKHTFVAHVKEVERKFWEERFPVYTRWKKDWFNAYLRSGEFTMLTGFTVRGIFKRNQVLNSPIQGSAFHSLLWAIIRIQRALDRRKMRSLLVAQVHDCLVADVPEDELQEYIDIAYDIMTRKLPAAWDWITVPMDVEVEVAPEAWLKKTVWERKEGVWQPKGK